jgi:hypothetical protein
LGGLSLSVFVLLQGMHGMLANEQASQQNLQVAHSQMLWLDGLMAAQGSDFIVGDSELPMPCCAMTPSVLKKRLETFDQNCPRLGDVLTEYLQTNSMNVACLVAGLC